MSEQKQGIPEEFLNDPSSEAAPEGPQSDVNSEDLSPEVVLMRTMAAISEVQMAAVTMNARIGELEKYVSYLLSKDPEYMEAFERMQRDVQAKAQEGQEDGSKGS